MPVHALLALIALARHKPGEYISGEALAQEQRIPAKFLALNQRAFAEGQQSV